MVKYSSLVTVIAIARLVSAGDHIKFPETIDVARCGEDRIWSVRAPEYGIVAVENVNEKDAPVKGVDELWKWGKYGFTLGATRFDWYPHIPEIFYAGGDGSGVGRLVLETNPGKEGPCDILYRGSPLLKSD